MFRRVCGRSFSKNIQNYQRFFSSQISAEARAFSDCFDIVKRFREDCPGFWNKVERNLQAIQEHLKSGQPVSADVLHDCDFSAELARMYDSQEDKKAMEMLYNQCFDFTSKSIAPRS